MTYITYTHSNHYIITYIHEMHTCMHADMQTYRHACIYTPSTSEPMAIIAGTLDGYAATRTSILRLSQSTARTSSLAAEAGT